MSSFVVRDGVVFFTGVFDFISKNERMSLISIHSSHESLVLVDVSADRTPRIGSSRNLTEG